MSVYSMKKIARTFLVTVVLILLATVSAMAAKTPETHFEPLSKAYLDWLEAQKKNENGTGVFTTDKTHSTGYIPFHIDLSHLADNPPIEDTGPGIKETIPTKYDLRNVGGKNYVTSVKNQNPYGTCWAHASIGAIESNLLKKGLGIYDLSEAHLAWFTFRNTSSNKHKTYENLSDNLATVFNRGGSAFNATTIFARLEGPTTETEAPYPNKPTKSTPESYTRPVRLRDAYYLALSNGTININNSTEARNIVKKRIMDNGAVVASFYAGAGATSGSGTSTVSYYDNSSNSTSPNHAIILVGWDDSYSSSKFSPNPGMNGAWLVKNSWGTSWGDGGYFWMSYAQYLTDGTAFIAEKADPNMKVYDNSPLGWGGTWGYSSSPIYTANVFKSERDNEKLTEVGFFTADNNVTYDIDVYTSTSTSMPSNPITGSSVSKMSGTMPYAGWHVVTLNTPVALTKGNYFSVVVTFKNRGKAPVEMKGGATSNAVIEAGSFFSYNGTNWTAGTVENINATVKAFTVTGSSTPTPTPTPTPTKPTITTISPATGYVGQPYSLQLTASGTTPISWSVSSGTLPAGLKLNASGLLSGTPTVAGKSNFNVTATNSAGTDTRSYMLTVTGSSSGGGSETVNITGTVGTSLTQKLTPSTATWSVSSGSLPSGISLNKTGTLSGKPTKAGTFSATLKHSSSKTVTANFTINPKPVKPAIKTSSLAAGTVGTAYSQAISVTGTETITMTVTGLPSGLSFNSSTRYITGTPTKAAVSTVTIKASNAGGTVTKSLKLTIKAQPPVIKNPGTLPNGIVGVAYSSVQFSTSSGTAPITWSVSGQPSGMKMSSSGLLNGTPTKAGTFNMTVKASNSGGNATLRVPITIIQKPAIKSAKMSNGTTDANYTAKFTATGATPITWAASGLPSGMTLTQTSTGTSATITGIPTTPGTFTIKLTLTNTAGTVTYSVKFTIKGVAPKLSVSLASGKVGQSYTGSRISATGTKPITISYTISASDLKKFGISSLGDLGLTFANDPANGTASITGTPTMSVKSLPITFTAKNSVSSATKKVNLTITGQKPSFTSPSSSTLNMTEKVNTNVTVNFKVTGTKKITFSMNKVSGFTLKQTGDFEAVLTGKTPARDATTTLTVTATNADGKATSRVVIKSQTPPSITTSGLASGTVNKSYSAKVTATGTKTIKWTVSGSLPPGVKFSNGTFSGKPTSAGSYSVTVKAENNIGTASRNYTVNVTAANTKAKSKSLSAKSSPQTSTLEAHSDTFTGTPAVTFGAYGISHRKDAENAGYLVAAVLPELTVNESGMHEIDISLDEDTPEGAELVWLAFAEKGKESDDDEIAEFYNEEGEEITKVPASRKITVSAWLNKGVKYSPIIAVR